MLCEFVQELCLDKEMLDFVVGPELVEFGLEVREGGGTPVSTCQLLLLELVLLLDDLQNDRVELAHKAVLVFNFVLFYVVESVFLVDLQLLWGC